MHDRVVRHWRVSLGTKGAAVCAWLVWVLALCGCDTEVFDSSVRYRNHDLLGTRGGYRNANTLVVGRATDSIALDPGRATDIESVSVIEQIYEKLIHFRPGSNELVPGLATSWTLDQDNRSWIFELRRGVTFHDGTPLNADAVVFSLERQRDPNHPYYRPDFNYWKSNFQMIEAVQKLDDYHVRVVLNRYYAPFLANMAIFAVAIVSPAAASERGQDFARMPVGTGPFRWVSWEGGTLVLERNEQYWGKKPAFVRLVFKTIPDHRQRLVALESGAIDIAHGLLPEEQGFVNLHPQLILYHSMVNSVTYLAMNTLRPPLHDVRVRRAINHAINREPIVKVLWQGMAKVADSPLPEVQWGHDASLGGYPYDPTAARALLSQAVADGAFQPGRRLALHVPSTPRPYLPNPERLGWAIQANLREVGIDTELVAKPLAEHVESLRRGEHDLAIYGWVGDSGDPDNFLYVLLSGDNTEVGRASNVSFLRDDTLTELLVRARRSPSPAERETLYIDAQALIHQRAPWVPLAYSEVAVAAREDIGGVHLEPSGILRYSDLFRHRRERRTASESVLSGTLGGR